MDRLPWMEWNWVWNGDWDWVWGSACLEVFAVICPDSNVDGNGDGDADLDKVVPGN